MVYQRCHGHLPRLRPFGRWDRRNYHGAGFTRSEIAYFGKNQAKSVTLANSSTRSARAPPGSLGRVGVQVQVAGTYSDLLTAPQYTYT